MEYVIMRKDLPIAFADISDDGVMRKVSKDIRNPEYAPLAHRIDPGWLKRWWEERSVPLTQGRVKEMLEGKGLAGPDEYLLKNLGLSLNDYYWIRPAASRLTWEDVNLYDNDFKENLLVKIGDSLSPNSSLRGDLEKSWQIRNGKRVLVKGNMDRYSSESINEVLASALHRKQQRFPYVEYRLVKIRGKEYDYGCCCESFTGQNVEYISAWDLMTSEKKPNSLSYYEYFIELCVKNGLDGKTVRNTLEYQILTDYVLANRDRHMNNIGVLRDADTLKFIGLAPVFDSGKCLFVGKEVPDNYADTVNQKVNSFSDEEAKLLKLVTDFSVMDFDRLLEEDEIREWYQKDSQVSPQRVERICRAYRERVDYLKDISRGSRRCAQT